MKSLTLFTFAVLLSLGVSPSTSFANDPLPGEVQSDAEESTQTNEAQDHCAGLTEYKQKQCCYRTQRIEDLQRDEFSIENENGETLFQLQKEHDQILADLKIKQGVLALQEDYLKYMRRLENPEDQEGGLSQLSSLNRLKADTREAIDQAYRLNFLHDAMEELKSDTGPFVNEQGQLVKAEDLYEHASQKCQDSSRVDGICTLLNPQSEFNQKNSGEVEISPSAIKEMMQNYLMAYGVSTENLDQSERLERHINYEKSLKKIPSSVLRDQISSYERFQQEQLNPLISDNKNSEIEQIKKCISGYRYGATDENCTSPNYTNDSLKAAISGIASQVSDQANQIMEAGFGQSLSSDQKKVVQNVLDYQVNAEVENLNDQDETTSITAEEQRTFEDVLSSVEDKLKVAARISERRAAKTQDAFFNEFEGDPDQLEKIQSKLMFQLCGAEGKEYSSSEMYNCLDGISSAQTDTTKNEINRAQERLQVKKDKIDQITSGRQYQRRNSFKNYYAHRTKEFCSVGNEDEALVSYTGQCHTGFNQDRAPVTTLLDSAQNVIAEVQFKENGGAERSISELSDIHEFCYNLDDQKRAQFEHECEMASNNYIEATTDYSELSPEVKDYISNNMAVYDPETGEVSYQKRKSTWGMIGINSARAVASSVPQFMQYQQTKMALPFMRDQAMAQKTYQHWYNQQFTANFFRPGGFTSFGFNGGLNYGVSPFTNSPNFGSRIPIGTPQGLNIP